MVQYLSRCSSRFYRVPLLFLVYINDIIDNIDSEIRLFADDTCLYIIVETPSLAAHNLNHDLESIHAWSMSWLVAFNPVKIESMVFSRKRNKPIHPTLYLDNVQVTTVQHKNLGFILSNVARWAAHISADINKACRRIGVLFCFV